MRYNLGSGARIPTLYLSPLSILHLESAPQGPDLLGASHPEPIPVCLDYSNAVPSSLWEEVLRWGHLEFSRGVITSSGALRWMLGSWIIPDSSQVFISLPQHPPP